MVYIMRGERMRYLFISLLLIFININLFSQETQTQNKVFLNIPGNNKINTEDTIQKLLQIKKIPIQKKEMQIQDIKLETDIAKDLTKFLRDLDEKSRGLYDFKSPFRDMVGTSSDNAVLDVSAERKAKKDNYKITVMQTAKPDSFMSSSTPKNKILPPSEFFILINGKSIKIKFSGGNIYQLFNAIQQQVGDMIDVRIINDTDNSSILVISGKETGEKNRLTFSGDISTLSNINLVGQSEPKTEEHKIDFSRLVQKSANAITADSNGVLLKPGDEGDVNMTPDNIKISDSTYFYFNAIMFPYKAGQQETNRSISNVDINLMEPVSVSNVRVLGGSLISYYEEKKEFPAEVSNFTEIITLTFDDGTVKTYLIDNSGYFSNSLSTYKGKTVADVTVRNKNTDREFRISDALFSTRISEGGIQPKNIISRACDSIINFNGVEVKRDNNNINNLVDGVTFTLKNESKESVNVNIDHDYKKVEDAILAWVDSYNKAMEYLHIVTKPNLDHTPLSQRSQDNLKEGVFETESTVIILMNKLRNITEEPYKTVYDRNLRLLEQIGLYTKKTGSFNPESEEWTSASMGLLNIDIDKLRAELKTRFDGVEQLFAYDTHGDFVKDSGVAVAANQTLRLGIGTGSFFERRISYNETKMKEERNDVEKMNRDLSSYEVDLREKFGKMNQAINETDEKEKWLNSQMKNQQ
jgi:flagellar hook-associated protein 2